MTAAQASTAGGASGAGETGGGEAVPPAFAAAVGALRDAAPRAGVAFAPLPAPRRLAPYAHALEASVTDPDEEPDEEAEPAELADGRFVLLHDPAGRESWQGGFRVVTLARAEPEPEMASDPLLPEVTWSWLTGALEARTAGHAAASGTVTRSDSAFFGDLAEKPQQTALEIRASWTPLPAGDDGPPDFAAHLAAWCELLAQCAGLPPDASAPGTDRAASVVQLPQRRGPQRR
ncbi:DUF3000 domain-containing protein [Streptomyces xiaopingdaonensis]|uniref:DUF3000 domain-containing protein n=1 Tax=Streptomyces xiaopingdaonensis TaxID=1565415 RepID=UPI00036C1BB9|nr:DUF3000 domain-containing protein [Streptomyces xiaopingdaonensis]